MTQRRIIALAAIAVIVLGGGCATQSTVTGPPLSAPAASPPTLSVQSYPSAGGWYMPSTFRFQAP
jgi:hypothetical protein